MATIGINVTTTTTTTTTMMTTTVTDSNEVNGSNVPQWKLDLIQRRRQQSKVLVNNGVNVKLCNAVIGTSIISPNTTLDNNSCSAEEQTIVREPSPVAGKFRTCTQQARPTTSRDDTAITCSGNSSGGGGGDDDDNKCVAHPRKPYFIYYATSTLPTSGAILRKVMTNRFKNRVTTVEPPLPSVACNMRLALELSLLSDVNNFMNSVPDRFADIEQESTSNEYHGRGRNSEERVELRVSDGKGRMKKWNRESDKRNCLAWRVEQITRPMKELSHLAASSVVSSEDAESDSSEELQYGPGIVNKLKSKYLNLTLRETNKNRTSVQRFRRAASLEDLLDRDDEESHEKITVRKYTKRNSGPSSSSTSSDVISVPTKTDRYRNASRGNDSIKRARSVETLMRYNNAIDEGTMRAPPRPATTNGIHQESVNDHIILVDRTSVKIENRLGELDRPKPVNKPKRIKPVLAETERPPPDLVKTTMKIFEGSARKLKPKGDVAAKVATFKTINETFKAQTQKKLMTQKPPLQPKPVVNGSGARVITNAGGNTVSPKRIVLPQKPTAELIETQDGQEEYHIDGVITEPIVQSVSSVVSKFQQIEKSHSPSPSPEPASCKLKSFSPANSPEPSVPLCKVKSALEIGVKSPPITPVLSPRISSPRLQSPLSPVKDISVKQGSPSVQSPSSPVKDLTRIQTSNPLHKSLLQNSSQDSSKIETTVDHPPKISHSQNEKDSTRTTNVERMSWQTRLFESLPINSERKEDAAKPSRVALNNEEEDIDDEEEIVDGPRTISKIALDNISKAGTTVQFNFGDKPISEKTYLPGTRQNESKSVTTDDQTSEDECCCKKNQGEIECRDKTEQFDAFASCAVTNSGTTSRLQELEKKETINDNNKGNVEEKPIVPEHNKPIGAICSLGLIKSSMTTMTSTGYLQSNNEAKTIRYQKTEFSPPQKQIGIIRPLVSTKIQHPQQNLSNREFEKNLINRVKSIEQPTKVVVSLKSTEEIQPMKKIKTADSVGGVVHGGSGGGSGGVGGLWDTKPWNQQNNTMVFNFSNRKDVPDYIENDGLIIRKKRDKSKIADGSIIVLDATLDASSTDDAEWEISGDPPSPCDVSFLNDNVLINGRSNLSKTPRNHKHRIQFDDTATRTFEYPSEASILEVDISCVDGETSSFVEQQSTPSNDKTSSTNVTTNMSSLLGGGGLASYTPSKVDLTSEGFELGITRAAPLMVSAPTSTGQTENINEVEYLKPAQDAGAWGSETTGDLLY